MKYRIFALTLLAVITGCSDSSDRNASKPPTISDLNIEPAYTVLDIGSSERYRAFATYSDGAVENVSAEVSWSLESDTEIVELTVGNDDLLATAVMAGQDNLLASLASFTATSFIEVVEAELVELTVSPAKAEMLAGYTQAFTAEGRYDDGHTQDLTDESAWSSDNSAVASVGNNGVATGESKGTATISASLEGLSGNAVVDVHEEAEIVSIEVSPQDVRMFVDGSQQFSAIAYYSDGTSQPVTRDALWTSSDTSVVAEDLFYKGQFNALSTGNAEVSAQVGVHNAGTTQVTVEEVVITHIVLTPKDFTLAVGDKKRYFTEAATSDGRFVSLNQFDQLRYEVGDGSVAYISNTPGNRGELTALGSGTTTVTSTFEYEGEVFTDQANVTVCVGSGC